MYIEDYIYSTYINIKSRWMKINKLLKNLYNKDKYVVSVKKTCAFK